MEKKHGSTQEAAAPAENASFVAKSIILFLQMFMTETLAKRFVSMMLIVAGMPNSRITEMTGLCDRSVRTLRKTIGSGNIGGLFAVGHGSGRARKAKGFEGAIVEELETNNYRTRQQIAEMILEKFGVSLSVSAVGKLLKKTASGG